MDDDVTLNLILIASTPNPTVEFSRASARGDFNAAMLEGWIRSADGAFDDVTMFLEGSNDLCNWSDVSLSIVLTETPDHQRSSGSEALPWQWLRIRFEAKGNGTRIAVMGRISMTESS